MTPRSVVGSLRSDFARQLAERNGSTSEKSQKKARTSQPKGVKLAAGYVDRAKARQEQQDEEDDRAQRLKALEESLKKDEIDQATYDRLRSEIAGGDLSSTHLVKGLDFKLLERIRKGEDVAGTKSKDEDQKDDVDVEEPHPETEEAEEDPDDILERLESKEVKAIEKEKVQKKGQVATTTLNPGQKRTRAQIIAELKASREAAKAKQESALGSRFKKIGEKRLPGTRIERDSKGRDVMIIIDEDGHEKRKIRKLDPKVQREQERQEAALMKDEVLGMEVPEFYRKQQEELLAAQEEKDKEITIFDDIESDYDPLAGLEDSDSDSDEEKENEKATPPDSETKPPPSTDMPPPPLPLPKSTPSQPRNYFKDSKTALTSQETYKAPSLNDPTLLAALQKAKAISLSEKSEEEQKNAEREARLKKKLQDSNRDDEDLDMGFGSSRVDDEADLAESSESKVKMSEWRGVPGQDDEDDDGEEGGKGEGKGKRKRGGGGKKRKGDKNSFADVMRVMERNKTGAGEGK